MVMSLILLDRPSIDFISFPAFQPIFLRFLNYLNILRYLVIFSEHCIDIVLGLLAPFLKSVFILWYIGCRPRYA